VLRVRVGFTVADAPERVPTRWRRSDGGRVATAVAWRRRSPSCPGVVLQMGENLQDDAILSRLRAKPLV